MLLLVAVVGGGFGGDIDEGLSIVGGCWCCLKFVAYCLSMHWQRFVHRYAAWGKARSENSGFQSGLAAGAVAGPAAGARL